MPAHVVGHRRGPRPLTEWTFWAEGGTIKSEPLVEGRGAEVLPATVATTGPTRPVSVAAAADTCPATPIPASNDPSTGARPETKRFGRDPCHSGGE